ncbi:hypothetical protein BDR07DRAFT_1401095 [Suillus spraguei]|nr:hypothetical protein BDR07DRAFT_1401095 [Suillus spraguei]
MRKLQAENDLLLDAINLTVPATPSLMHLTRPSPTLHSHPPHDITTSDRDRDYRDIPPETTANGRL